MHLLWRICYSLVGLVAEDANPLLLLLFLLVLLFVLVLLLA